MRIVAAAALSTVIATVTLALIVSTANARIVDYSSSTYRITFSELEFVAGSVTNTCAITLEGSLHARTMTKVLNSLMGYITRAEANNCRVVTTLLTETLPWHVRYRGFSGNLPNITLLLIRARANFQVATCLASAEFDARLTRTPSTGALTGLSVPTNANLPLTGILCPAPRLGSLRSNRNGTITQLNSSTLITVTLI